MSERAGRRSGSRAGWASATAAALLGALVQCRSFPPPPPGFSMASFEQLASDPTLRAFALEQGAAIFDSECTLCHGPDRRGRPGYPDLGDDEWIWGRGPEAVATVVRHGVRLPGERKGEFAAGTRHGAGQSAPVAMPPFKGALSETQIEQLAAFCERLIALPSAASERDVEALFAAPDAALYAQACAPCHGVRGEGKLDQGFVRLRGAGPQVESRDVGDLAELIEEGMEARTMKAFAGSLSEDEIRCVALFVAEAAAAGQPTAR